jgi:hypothetical protein
MMCGCVTVPDPPAETTAGEGPPQTPVILFWARDRLLLTEATYMVNDVWAGDRTNPGDEDPRKHVDSWLARGVIPLDWAGGNVYLDREVEELTRKWSSKFEAGHYGIAIDEFGWNNKKEIWKFIAVWHTGLLNNVYCELYKQYVDLVLLESYFPPVSLRFRIDFDTNVRLTRKYGISTKCVFALGLDPNKWLRTPKAAEKRMVFIKENAPEMPGIAFFAPRISTEFMLAVEKTAASLYK